MKTTPYQRGYTFERKTKAALEKAGYMVLRSGKSKFPDLIALSHIRDPTIHYKVQHQPLVIECKKGKYITRDEREKFKAWEGRGVLLVAYPKLNPGKKTDIIFCDLNYHEVMRL